MNAQRKDLGRGLAALACLGAIYLTLAGLTLRAKSVTVDEFGHLPAGLNLWNSGDFAYGELNPPLMNALSALPLKLAGIRTVYPRDFPQDSRHGFWANGYLFMGQHRADYQGLFVRARWVTVALVGLLGVVAFAWGRLLVPARPNTAGLLAAALIWFSPEIMSHACLVTTDAGMATFMVAAAFALYLYLREPTWGRAIVCGAALGAAQLIKFTAIYLYPTHLAILVLAAWVRPDLRTRRYLLQALAVFAVSVLVINAGYGFQGCFTRAGSLAYQSVACQALGGQLGSFIPMPLPQDYVLAFDRQLADTQRGDPSFLFGHSYAGGRWYYFLALLAVKTPVPALILLGFAVFAAVVRKGLRWTDSIVLLLPALVIFVMFSFFSNKQLGLRMILPAIALVVVWTGAALASVAWSRVPRVLVGVAVAWLGFEFVRIHPDYLAYFNQFAGRADRGYHYAVDSNLDWGQDLPALNDYLEREHIEEIQLLYFGRVDPEIYGIRYRVPLGGLRAGYVAISRTLLGRGYFLYDHGRTEWAGPFTVDPRGLVKVGTVGHTIDIYRVLPAALGNSKTL